MDMQYAKMAKIFKALSDPKRVRIVDMLSCVDLFELRERREFRQEVNVGGENGDNPEDDGNAKNNEPLDDLPVAEKGTEKVSTYE